MTSISQLEESLPSDWYTDQSIFTLEAKEIFGREWYCVAREQEVPGPGDHLVLDVQGESVLLVRNQQSVLNAFYNVCRHRGAQLCDSTRDDGHKLVIKHGGVTRNGSIVCPYHTWTYDLDGQLQRAPHMNDFDTAAIQLYPVALETWGGFVFVCLMDSPPDFQKHVDQVVVAYERYPLATLATAHHITYEVQSNWKLLCENFNECYHCGPVHPELSKLVPAFRDQGGANLSWEEGIPHREGATTFTFTGDSDRRSFPLLNEAEQVRHKGDLLFPNLFLSLSRDYVVAIILKPVSSTHTTMSCYFLFETFEMEKATFSAQDAISFWDLINQQDWAICESVQRGVSARVHKKGVYSPMEDWNLDLRSYVRNRIGKFVP
jgi:Rieske 2Fe-2S family protein